MGTVSEQTNSDKLFKFILKCQRNSNKPDLHSFVINIACGRAFVECRGYEVYIETYINKSGKEEESRWCGTAVAATNKLELLGADYRTIEM